MPPSSRDEEFSAFVQTRRTGLVRSACLLTAGDTHLAEDLVQTALARLYVAWPKVRRAGTESAYVWRIVVNAHIDEVRRPGRRRERHVPELPEPPASPQAKGWVVQGSTPYALVMAPPNAANKNPERAARQVRRAGRHPDPHLPDCRRPVGRHPGAGVTGLGRRRTGQVRRRRASARGRAAGTRLSLPADMTAAAIYLTEAAVRVSG